MKEIKLTQGQIVLVDDEDYEYLNQWKWSASKYKELYYASTNLPIENSDKKRYKTTKMHRVIMNITNSKIHIDHRDGNGLNNQKSNLRTANFSQNNHNRKKIDNFTSRYKGVYLDKTRSKPWRVCVSVNYKYLKSKSFYTEQEAAIYANELMSKNHGEFAKLNIL